MEWVWVFEMEHVWAVAIQWVWVRECFQYSDNYSDETDSMTPLLHRLDYQKTMWHMDCSDLRQQKHSRRTDIGWRLKVHIGQLILHLSGKCNEKRSFPYSATREWKRMTKARFQRNSSGPKPKRPRSRYLFPYNPYCRSMYTMNS
jgi:hypothetical protein